MFLKFAVAKAFSQQTKLYVMHDKKLQNKLEFNIYFWNTPKTQQPKIVWHSAKYFLICHAFEIAVLT